MRGIQYVTIDRIHSDARIIGISVTGFWMVTAKYQRLKMAWALLCLSLSMLFQRTR